MPKKKPRPYPDISEEEKKQLAKQRLKSGAIDFYYDARHDLKHAFIYEPCKAIITGFKKLWGLRPWKKQKPPLDPPSADIDISTLSPEQKQQFGIDPSTTSGTYKLELKDREPKQIGGTKTMMSYTGTDGSKWLMKRAEDSVGRTKLSGALLTEAGYKLQNLVDPNTAVEAFASKTNEDGVVSFQRELQNVVKSDRIDLFYFSRHHERMHQKEFKQIEDMGDQILREHVSDWLLCNFDTKGENFVVTESEPGKGDFTLHGIDKENAFKKILSGGAQHMSSSYKPHNYDTLYNGIFTEYAKGRMNLNLDVMKDKVSEIVSMKDEDYMKTFSVYLDNVRKKDPTKYAETYANILKRKNELGSEYNRFFGELVNERCKNVSPEEKKELQQKYLTDGKFTAFKEKAVTPATIGKEKTTKLREEGFAQLSSADPKVKAEGVCRLLLSQIMNNKIVELSSSGDKNCAQKVDKLTSPEVINQNLTKLAQHPAAQNVMKAVIDGRLNISNSSFSASALETVVNGFNNFQKNKEVAPQKAAEPSVQRGENMALG